MLHFVANPGAAPVTDVPWWIIVAVVAIALLGHIMYTVRDIVVNKNPFEWDDLVYAGATLMIATAVALFPAAIVYVVQDNVQEDAWFQKVQHWLADDYGVTVNTDQVRTLSGGDQVIVTVGGHRVPLSITADRDRLIPSVGEVLLPTRSR